MTIAPIPDDVWIEVLDYLDAYDVVSTQRVSARLLSLGRDNRVWRYKCFEKAPSAAAALSNRPDAIAALTGALGGLSISESPLSQHDTSNSTDHAIWALERNRKSKRARAVAEWDQTAEGEQIDWYSEFIARHATLHTEWTNGMSSALETRGCSAFDNSRKVLGCLEDGSVQIWDIGERAEGIRHFGELGRSEPGVLFTTHPNGSGASSPSKNRAFGGVTECVSVGSKRQKAYIAVEEVLNEVDLETLQVISQNQYAWSITALSQEGEADVSLSVGTSWSLHLYDPRVPLRDRSRSPEDLLRATPAEAEASIAFIPNYLKRQPREMPILTGTTTNFSGLASLSALRFPRPPRRSHLADYAHMEPGPLSILHHDDNEILIAGRFPSILSYDRRYFPRLQYVMHSGARLSAITSIPHPPKSARGRSSASATLIACGEYGGRGSLELYSLPHIKTDHRITSGGLTNLPSTEHGTSEAEGTFAFSPPEQAYPFSYKNRQEASSSKLLSVAVQGTRIVVSDAEGGLKWFERDGRGLARRWNINTYQIGTQGASLSGETVVRKIMPLVTNNSTSLSSDRGDRGDGDLLVWTGERVGIVTMKPQWSDHAELAAAFDNVENEDEESEKEEQVKAEEYSKQMRRALEGQADERRWMSRFGIKRNY